MSKKRKRLEEGESPTASRDGAEWWMLNKSYRHERRAYILELDRLWQEKNPAEPARPFPNTSLGERHAVRARVGQDEDEHLLSFVGNCLRTREQQALDFAIQASAREEARLARVRAEEKRVRLQSYASERNVQDRAAGSAIIEASDELFLVTKTNAEAAPLVAKFKRGTRKKVQEYQYGVPVGLATLEQHWTPNRRIKVALAGATLCLEPEAWETRIRVTPDHNQRTTCHYQTGEPFQYSSWQWVSDSFRLPNGSYSCFAVDLVLTALYPLLIKSTKGELPTHLAIFIADLSRTEDEAPNPLFMATYLQNINII